MAKTGFSFYRADTDRFQDLRSRNLGNISKVMDFVFSNSLLMRYIKLITVLLLKMKL